MTDSRLTPLHRGGSGTPLVLLHGFMDDWRTWELVLGALERRHDVLAVTMPGHGAGPRLPAELDDETLVRGVEEAMDAAGFRLAHVAGNSLGGTVALQLAARGRARSVVAFAPAGGWASGDDSWKETLDLQQELIGQVRGAAPHADALVATPQGRRRPVAALTVRHEHIPPELLAHLTRASAAADAEPLLSRAREHGWPFAPELIGCPVRIVWGTADVLTPWPRAAERFRRGLPRADWVVLDDVGHAPQLDVPVEAAQLIMGFTG